VAPIRLALTEMDEANRILREYERRERALAPDLYAPTKPFNLFLRQSRERALVKMLTKAGFVPFGARRILDVGCGSGQWLIDFETWGAERGNLAGIDLIPSRIRVAQRRLASWRASDGQLLASGADVREGDASTLPWDDGTFDLVCQSMVFSSILDASMREVVATEMVRVLAPGGVLVWYDFFASNPRNPNVRGIRRPEVARLFPGFSMTVTRATLMPPLARRLVPVSRLLAESISALKLLNMHYLILLRRRER
ncbi:MAG: class I SAM-dependent methyltransferase, partial [Burkholderiales bacterium]